MSRGISIYYKLIDSTEDKVVYGYSGMNISYGYDEKIAKAYDGRLVITKDALYNKEIDKIKWGIDYYTEKDCAAGEELDNHRLKVDEENSMQYFAVKALYKIFTQYKKNGVIDQDGAVIY